MRAQLAVGIAVRPGRVRIKSSIREFSIILLKWVYNVIVCIKEVREMDRILGKNLVKFQKV